MIRFRDVAILALFSALLLMGEAERVVTMNRNRFCQVSGDNIPYAETKMQGQNKQDVCRLKCSKETRCKAFFFNGLERMCYRYEKDIEKVAKYKKNGAEKMFCGVAKESSDPSEPDNSDSNPPDSINDGRSMKLRPKRSCVVDSENVPKVIKMSGKNKQTVCRDKCLLDKDCKGIYFDGVDRKCHHYFKDISKLKIDSTKTAAKKFCGIVTVDEVPTVPSSNPTLTGVPTITQAPSTSPTAEPSVVPSSMHTKEFVWQPMTKCEGPPDPDRSEKYKTTITNLDACIMKCGQHDKCKSFSWKESKLECVLYYYRVKKIIPAKPDGLMAVCGKLPKPIVPSTSPSIAPTMGATKAPKCVLRAELAFPYKDPDDAPYYGYHACFLEVTKKSDKKTICSAAYYDDAKDWCTYKNSIKGYDITYIENTEDYYYPDAIEDMSSETVVVRDARDEKITFASYHYFLDEDYYSTYKEWSDHMLSPVLKIWNKSNPNQDNIGLKKGWTHPTNKKIKTHIKRKDGSWAPNPQYKGNFVVTVTCNKNCYCKAEYKARTGVFNRMAGVEIEELKGQKI